MGRYYALSSENPQVADAIADHYKPQGPNDICPTAPVSVIVALADKLDSLAAFFAIGEKPTGSRDPFALRRAALGVIRIILENKLRCRLGQTLSQGVYNETGTVLSVIDFIVDRLKVHLRDAGVRHDLVSAAFVSTEDDLLRLIARIDALEKFLDSEDGPNLLIAYRRAASIVAIEERRDKRSYSGLHGGRENEHLLVEAEEKRLSRALRAAAAAARSSAEDGQFHQAMGALATLRRPVDEFFDKVTVNADDPALRENRLRLLSRIRAVMNQVADFSQIEG
jgi:glycyl-tRNA synthetase beta chain